ncbi:arylsulfatase [Shewanella submarina]|uniref:Arylsulfatase n=1 Tax=Shewanella submarina TaxID=2016376 RepID=A0ABV7G783_9GAMM|nr:arylsulfatase [Shewanella submarina]
MQRVLLLVGAVSLGLAGCAQPESPSALDKTSRPNVIYILADDLGIGDIGAYGQQKIRTPNIDRLAAEGMRFSRHYSGSAVCAPSRASLMTGMDMGHAAVRGNYQQKKVPATPDFQGQYPLPQGSFTLAHLFQDAGYQTGAFGKWGLGSLQSSGNPQAMGFDEFYGYLDQRNAHNYFPGFLWHNRRMDSLQNPPINVHPRPGSAGDYQEYMGPDYAPYLIVARAKEFIRKHKDEAFFLYLPFVVPHAALQIPDAELEGYDFDETPHMVTDRSDYTPHPRPRAARAAMISRMDRDVGEVMALLKELELDSNTLVLFSSDNGAATAGGSDIEFFNSTNGLRGEKATLYEGGIRAPLIARWPGQVEPGSHSGVISAFWDILPTFAELLGKTVPADIQGKSVLSSMLEQDQNQIHDALYWEFHSKNPSQAVIMGDWKAIRHFHKSEGRGRALSAGPIALYNLARDPSETNNLASLHPELVQQAEQLMAQRQVSPRDEWNFN